MKPLLVLTLVGVSCAWAQNNSGLNARELFYTPVPEANPSTPATPANPSAKTVENAKKQPAKKNPPAASNDHKLVAAASAPVPLGLRYSVLKRDSSNVFREVDPDTTFHSGDRIRVQVSANTSGYLYVVTQGSSGQWSLLFPSPEVSGGSNLIQKGETRVVPSASQGQWYFNDQAGTEKLFVVLTRQPEPDLDKLIYSVGGQKNDTPGEARTLLAKATISDQTINRLRSQVAARDLVFEKVDADPGTGTIEKAAYVVNPSRAPDARLVVDVALRHQ